MKGGRFMKKITSKDYAKRLHLLGPKLFIERIKGMADAKKGQLIENEKLITTPEIEKKYAIILGEINNLTEIMLYELSEYYETVMKLVNEYREIKALKNSLTKPNKAPEILQKESCRKRDRQRVIISELSLYREKIIVFSENHIHEIEQIQAVEKAKITAYWSGVLRVKKDLKFFNRAELDLENNDGFKMYKHNRDRLLEVINSTIEEGGESYDLV